MAEEEKTTEVAEETEKGKRFLGLKPKQWSLVSKVLAVVIIIGGNILKGFGIMNNLSSTEINTCGLVVMSVFGTVDINIALDKFLK